jgi:magnesium transporter
MPVVDNEDRLVGIITYDDAFTVQEEEATEDFEKMAAISPSEEPYLKTGVFRLSMNRIPWLLLLMVFAMLTGGLVSVFEDSLAALPALVAFIPMLMNTGGNAGSQSTTLIIRGMALDEIKKTDVARVLWMETQVSLVCGAILFISTFISVLIFGEGTVFAITVCLAMLAVIVTSNVIGVILTFGAKAVKLDPAVMAAPLLTNIVDAAALIIYFVLARVILRI